MTLHERIRQRVPEIIRWRHDLHAHPETAFEEHRTAARVAEILSACPGVEVHTGLAGTGVVATLDGRRPGEGSVGLRADLDALHIEELNDFDHRSTHPGRMHACGHDGHTAMLLGAAVTLAEDPDFAGRVHFIFQPAEENEGGGGVMVREGLFDRFPCDQIFGLHNWPGLPVGHFSIRPGPVMAAFDIFEITVSGRGGHAAMPHQGVDPMVVAAHIITGLQSVVSRTVNPVEAAVISVTRVQGGHTWNVIPHEVTLQGTVRALQPEVHDALEPAMRRLARLTAQAHGAEATLRYERRYPPTVNTPGPTRIAQAAACEVVGSAQVHRDQAPSMGGEDFAFMLQARPGCYVWLGTGVDRPGLHHPRFDFNDEVIETGVRWWVETARRALQGRASR